MTVTVEMTIVEFDDDGNETNRCELTQKSSTGYLARVTKALSGPSKR